MNGESANPTTAMPSSGPAVSIIVPVYNVEEYLEQCLDSVLAQTLQDIEIICVNDGSTDSSPAILNAYAAKDARVQVVSKANGGYGHSINRGIECASGEWIGIVEPDDFIDARMYEDLLANAYLVDGGVPDIVKSSYWLYYDAESPDEEPYVKQSVLSERMRTYRFEFNVYDDTQVIRHHPSIWSAIYRRDFLMDNDIRMREIPGAGWADNPWLYETMLQAKSVVWIPPAYYYYRQTNPNASCSLKDYMMVFDRLRDIREIYRRFNVTNEDLLLALYLRTVNYIFGTLLEEFKFPESNPELLGLIEEAFADIDPALVAKKRNGISEAKKTYILDFIGEKMRAVDKREANGDPIFSLIVPMRNDRKGFWPTVDSILKQDYEDFEVVLVNCNSNDRCPQIARELALRDKRFTFVEGGTDSVAEGFMIGLQHSRAPYVSFFRCGIELFYKRCLSQVAKAISSENVPDVVVTAYDFKRFRAHPEDMDPGVQTIDCAGRPELVAANLWPEVYGKVFRREMVEGLSLPQGQMLGEDGLALNVSAFANVKNAALVSKCGVRTTYRDSIRLNEVDDKTELASMAHERLDAMAQAAEKGGSEAIWRVARGCMLGDMRGMLGKYGYKRMGKTLYDSYQDDFAHSYSLRSVGPAYYANYMDYRDLEIALSTSYEQFLQMNCEATDKRIKNLTASRDAYRTSRDEATRERNEARKELERIKNSRSYKVSSKMSSVLRR